MEPKQKTEQKFKDKGRQSHKLNRLRETWEILHFSWWFIACALREVFLIHVQQWRNALRLYKLMDALCQIKIL